MPRARAQYRDDGIRFSARLPEFDAEALKRIRTICPARDFESEMQRLAYQCLHWRERRPVPEAAVLATLADLHRRANELYDLLHALPRRAQELLELSDRMVERQSRPLNELRRALARFGTSAYVARHSAKARPGRPENEVERYAAQVIRALFAEFGIAFKATDDSRLTKDNPAAVCLRLALGLKDEKPVNRYLQSTLRKK